MMDEEKFEKKGDKLKPKFVPRTPMEVQRIKLEKLMSHPSKPVVIPTAKQKKDFANAIPSFIRNVMGSSAGAGSGEFHVYRHLRRKEYARQKHIQQKSKQETLDEEYQKRLENNRLQFEEKTAKKRAKRLKRKQKAKNKAKMPKVDQDAAEKSGSDSDEEESEEEDESVKKENDKSETSGNNENEVNEINEGANETNCPTKSDVVVEDAERRSPGPKAVDETAEEEENKNVSRQPETTTEV